MLTAGSLQEPAQFRPVRIRRAAQPAGELRAALPQRWGKPVPGRVGVCVSELWGQAGPSPVGCL